VTERDRKGIGDVGWLRQAIEAQLGGDGILDLSFAGSSTAGDQFFDASGGIANDRQSTSSPRQKENAAGMGHEDGRAGMSIMGVELLDG
jgi:hypothetical protein